MRFKGGAECSTDGVNHLKTNNLKTLITCKLAYAGISFEKERPKIHFVAKTASICFILTYLLQIIALVNATEDIDRLFECFSVISFCGMGILKLISLYRNHKHWNSLLNTILALERQLKNMENDSNVEYESDDEDTSSTFIQHIMSYTGKFETLSTLLSRMYGTTAVIYIISPFAEYFLMAQEPLRLPHILPGWAPLDNINFFGYLVTIFIEIIAAIYCVCVHVVFDLMSVGIMMFICGQFTLLRDYSQNIGGKGRTLPLSKDRDRRAHYRITKCHSIHIILTTAIEKLSKLLENILGVYFFLATLTLCSVAVRFNSELSSMQLVSLLQYTCATLTQLFLFCRYGDHVLHESSVKMGEGPFGAAYWCLSPNIRKELVLLGMGMMLPRCLYAGPFNKLDLPSFIQVVRTAYSYYAVIRK